MALAHDALSAGERIPLKVTRNLPIIIDFIVAVGVAELNVTTGCG